MKLAFTATSAHMDALYDPRFGRCAFFILIDEETGEWESIPNPAVNSRGGAGTQAAQFIANQGVGAIVSGRFGPNAFMALQTAGIKMYGANKGNISELYSALKAGELKMVTSASSSGRRQRGGR